MPEPTLTAQQIFDSIKAGDEALRAKVNRAAAEACGYTKHADYPADKRMKHPEEKVFIFPPDYTRDLTACAGLPLPENMTMKISRSDVLAVWFENINDSALACEPSMIVRSRFPELEALARAACWYVATQGGDDAKRS